MKKLHLGRKTSQFEKFEDLFVSQGFVWVHLFGLPVNVALDEVPLVLFHVLTHLLPGDEV